MLTRKILAKCSKLPDTYKNSDKNRPELYDMFAFHRILDNNRFQTVIYSYS